MDNQEKIKKYTRYRNRMNRVIKNVSDDEILENAEKIRFIHFLNMAKYHCQGKINKLKESKGEN